jgi:hypothetical protein
MLSNPEPSAPNPEREVPRPVRYFTGGFIFRKLTLKERFQIAFGFNLSIEAHLASECRPGRVQPLIHIHTTKFTDGESAMKEMKEKQAAEKAPTLPKLPADAALSKKEGF